MGVEWDMQAIRGMVAGWTNLHAQRVDQIAQLHLGGETSMSPATPDEPAASIVGGEDSMVREYGTATEEPRPWGLPSLMEASGV